MRMLLPIGLALTLLIPVIACAQGPEPKDTTLGQAPPEGAIVLLGDGDELAGWVKADGTTPAGWPAFESGSAFPCPYGWSASGGRRDTATL